MNATIEGLFKGNNIILILVVLFLLNEGGRGFNFGGWFGDNDIFLLIIVFFLLSGGSGFGNLFGGLFGE